MAAGPLRLGLVVAHDHDGDATAAAATATAPATAPITARRRERRVAGSTWARRGPGSGAGSSRAPAMRSHRPSGGASLPTASSAATSRCAATSDRAPGFAAR